MDIECAKKILKTLANGTDPLTGEILPDDHVCNKVEVVRAILCVLDVLESKGTSSTKEPPENAGRPWTKEDDMKLAKMYDEGASRLEMVNIFRRTNGAIASRLARLGKIDNRDAYELRK